MKQTLRVRMTDAANHVLEQDFTLVTRNGGVVSEFWLNNNPVHPLLVKAPRTPPYSLGFSPDRVEYLGQAEFNNPQGESYCNNLFAWLVPSTSGDYRFWIAADDEEPLREQVQPSVRSSGHGAFSCRRVPFGLPLRALAGC